MSKAQGSGPFIEDRWDELEKMRREAETPLDILNYRIESALCHLMTMHDITEQLVGDPDWWRQ